MKERGEILEFYGRELEPALRALEGRRKSILVRFLVSLGVTILAAGLTALLTGAGSLLPAAIILIVGLIVTATIVWGPAMSYTREFKQRIIAPIVKFLGPELRYSPEGMIPEGLYLSSEIFRQRPDRYKGDDLVTGVE